jgi:hypothetical protein
MKPGYNHQDAISLCFILSKCGSKMSSATGQTSTCFLRIKVSRLFRRQSTYPSYSFRGVFRSKYGIDYFADERR